MNKKIIAILSVLVIVLFVFSLFCYENILKVKHESSSTYTRSFKTLENINAKVKFLESAYLVHVNTSKKAEELNSEYNVNFLNDYEKINSSLLYIEKFLLSFNKSFFKRLCDDDKTINIYLASNIKRKEDNVTIAGVYYKNAHGYNIVINAKKYEEIPNILAHELMHLIEDFLEEKGVTFDAWDLLNPKDFKYNSNNNNNYSDVYFIDKYAKLSSREDRASIFRAIYEGKSFNDYPKLEAKMNYLKEVLLINIPELNYLPIFIA